ncbi:hypothetical protein [Gemmatimonas sp.]|uniref:AbiTii domain-containing protein n=1 Tax=Gemmatimonas sp. TaxID=1962908 RepID=UPI00286E5C7D|nr:hypothetical protein [Gemmatimonas sp.]
MTSLVIELQRDALNRAVKTSDLLRKALVVARKLGVAEFETWINHELLGYPEQSVVPEYRVLRGKVKAWNPYNGMWIPMVMEDTARAEELSKRGSMQGVAELEALVGNPDKSGSLQMPFSKAVTASLMRNANVPLEPTLIISTVSIVGILDTVRNSVLDWSMKLEADGILGEGMTFSAAERERAISTINNTTHFHASVSNSQIQQFTETSSQSQTVSIDLNLLAELLKKVRTSIATLDLPPEDLAEAEVELKTLELQAASPKPKFGVVRESLKSLRTIVEGATGSLVASGMAAEIAKLLGTGAAAF